MASGLEKVRASIPGGALLFWAFFVSMFTQCGVFLK